MKHTPSVIRDYVSLHGNVIRQPACAGTRGAEEVAMHPLLRQMGSLQRPAKGSITSPRMNCRVALNQRRISAQLFRSSEQEL